LAKRYNLNPQDVIVDYTEPGAFETTPQLPSAVSYSDPLKQAAWEAYKRNQVGSGVRR